MLAVVKAVHLKDIISLMHKLHLEMKDALELHSTVKATYDTDILEMWALLEICWFLTTHLSCSIKSSH